MGLAERLKDFIGYPDDESEHDITKAVDSPAFAPAQPAVSSAVALVKLNRFEDASLVVDHLLSNRMVLFSLRDVPREVSRRLIDFLGGAAYAKDAQISRVSDATYMIAPYNVQVEEEQIGATDFGSVFF